MRTAVLLHGTSSKDEYYNDRYPSASNSHWLPWLQKQLLINDILTSTPEMFKSYSPNYNSWKLEFEKNIIDTQTTLVGHSCGGGFIIRWLSENRDVKVDKVILVAPWLDPSNEKNSDFFNFEMDSELIFRCNKFLIFNSINDSEDIKISLDMIRNKIKEVNIINFENYGHFCFSDLKTEKFPELLKEILD